MTRRILLSWPSLMAIALGGCVANSSHGPEFLRVDQTAPAFQEAVAREKERRMAKGISARRAEKGAIASAIYNFGEAEKRRRLELVAPLTEALAAFERPCGCWSYTTTTTVRREDRMTVTVERFDPFQPEQQVWTLVSRDGETPDEASQAAYRRAQLRSWKKEVESRAKTSSRIDAVKATALAHTLEVRTGAAGEAIFSISDNRESAPGGRFRRTYAVDPGHRIVVRETRDLLAPFSMLGLSFREGHTALEYVQIEPALPPFVARAHYRYDDSSTKGRVETEVVYSDYRRVTCYDDRFEVKMGPPTFIDHEGPR